MLENHLKFRYCKVAKMYMSWQNKNNAKHWCYPLLSSILVTGKYGRVRILTGLTYESLST